MGSLRIPQRREPVKQRIPDVAVVAEMMSADWGHDQVILAAEAGADIAVDPATAANHLINYIKASQSRSAT